jgi:hypothetical protein
MSESDVLEGTIINKELYHFCMYDTMFIFFFITAYFRKSAEVYAPCLHRSIPFRITVMHLIFCLKDVN